MWAFYSPPGVTTPWGRITLQKVRSSDFCGKRKPPSCPPPPLPLSAPRVTVTMADGSRLARWDLVECVRDQVVVPAYVFYPLNCPFSPGPCFPLVYFGLSLPYHRLPCLLATRVASRLQCLTRSSVRPGEECCLQGSDPSPPLLGPKTGFPAGRHYPRAGLCLSPVPQSLQREAERSA